MMKVDIDSGKYILAVSGGVDSTVLLNLLSNFTGVELIIAHFNHGIRVDSQEDEKLVLVAAKQYDWPVEVGYGRLGSGASEEAARSARYNFLYGVQKKHKAKKLITAHHQDDLIETALINMIRGTGRRGLSSIMDNKQVLRPLLSLPKSQIVAYAKAHKIVWRQDSTNSDQDHLRNYLRHNIVPKLSDQQRKNLLKQIDSLAKTNRQIDAEMALLGDVVGDKQIDRQLFTALPSKVGNEYLAHLLRENRVLNYDAKTINRLSMAIKTAKPNSQQPIKQNTKLNISVSKAVIVTS